MDLPTIPNGTITSIVDEVKERLGNPLGAAIGGGVAGLAIGGATAAGINKIRRHRKKKAKKKASRHRKRKGRRHRKLKFGSKAWRKKYHTPRGWKQDRARRSKEPWEQRRSKHHRKQKRFVKGSAAAKRFMAHLRSMRRSH